MTVSSVGVEYAGDCGRRSDGPKVRRKLTGYDSKNIVDSPIDELNSTTIELALYVDA